MRPLVTALSLTFMLTACGTDDAAAPDRRVVDVPAETREAFDASGLETETELREAFPDASSEVIQAYLQMKARASKDADRASSRLGW